MISEKCAKAQIVRLSGLSRYPDKDGLSELKRVLLRDCVTDYQCEKAITLALDESAMFCPSPSQLTEFITRSPERMSGAGCERCGGEGWYHVPQQHGHGTMVCCVCDLGRAKARVARGDAA